MNYSELTRRYFENTPALGVLESTPADRGVFRGSAGQRQRGTWVQFDIRVQRGHILDARFLALGCPHTIAAASWVAEQARGQALRAALPEPVQCLRARFEIPPEKTGRLLIVEDAWLAATASAIDPLPDAPIS